MGELIDAGSKKSPGVPDTGNTAAPTLASPSLTATATEPVFKNAAKFTWSFVWSSTMVADVEDAVTEIAVVLPASRRTDVLAMIKVGQRGGCQN